MKAVDQLAKFNRALIDHAQTDQPRTIDGIVLTKFDTIDDKVLIAHTLFDNIILYFHRLEPLLA